MRESNARGGCCNRDGERRGERDEVRGWVSSFKSTTWRRTRLERICPWAASTVPTHFLWCLRCMLSVEQKDEVSHPRSGKGRVEGGRRARRTVDGVADEEEDANGVEERSARGVLAVEVARLVAAERREADRLLGGGTLGELRVGGQRARKGSRFAPSQYPPSCSGKGGRDEGSSPPSRTRRCLRCGQPWPGRQWPRPRRSWAGRGKRDAQTLRTTRGARARATRWVGGGGRRGDEEAQARSARARWGQDWVHRQRVLCTAALRTHWRGTGAGETRSGLALDSDHLVLVERARLTISSRSRSSPLGLDVDIQLHSSAQQLDERCSTWRRATAAPSSSSRPCSTPTRSRSRARPALCA